MGGGESEKFMRFMVIDTERPCCVSVVNNGDVWNV
jgi:hypothetical protein